MGILDLIFPKVCLECGREGVYICSSCLSKVEVLNRFNPKTNTFSVFAYSGVVRKAIIKLKYNFAEDTASDLATITYNNFINPFGDNCVLIPIPLHSKRQNWRGFNQSEVVGKLLAQKLNFSFNPNILIRPEQGKTQVGLKGIERVRNICGKFALNYEAKLDQNITYIIFDDVVTTGATLNETISLLKNQGIQEVFGLTIAK